MTTQLERNRSHSQSLARPLVVVEATAAALVVWAIGRLCAVPFTVGSGPSAQTVGATTVVSVAVLAGLAGWGSLALLERLVARPRKLWTALAATVLAVSLLGPVGSAVGAATTATLTLIHLAVGLVLIVELRRHSSR